MVGLGSDLPCCFCFAAWHCGAPGGSYARAWPFWLLGWITEWAVVQLQGEEPQMSQMASVGLLAGPRGGAWTFRLLGFSYWMVVVQVQDADPQMLQICVG
jgi:hypothetical protein